MIRVREKQYILWNNTTGGVLSLLMQYDITRHTTARLYNSIKFSKWLLSVFTPPLNTLTIAHTLTHTLFSSLSGSHRGWCITQVTFPPRVFSFIYGDINKYSHLFIDISWRNTHFSFTEISESNAPGTGPTKWPTNSGQEFRPLARPNPSWSQRRQKVEGEKMWGRRRTGRGRDE